MRERLLRWWRSEDLTEEIARRVQEARENDIEYGGWGLLGNGRPNAAAWPCVTCGAVVIDRARHDEWHQAR